MTDHPDLLLPEALQAHPDPLGRRIAVAGAADAVVDRLVTAVALGIYVPGQRLPAERDLVGMLQVSRTTVREGLRRMVEAGYLEVRRGRSGGWFVLSGWGPRSAEMVQRSISPDWEHFEALFDARRLIEGLIADTAARRRPAEALPEMFRAAADYRAAPDREASRAADARLHRAVAQASGNAVLVGLSTQMRARVTLNLGAEPYTEQVRATAVTQHEDLVQAVADQDAERARAIAADHFGLTEKLIRDLLTKVGKNST
ncbi:FadR family transcriptional regulator [Nakamurella flavida]|uniref:FadR family transcriptional regulator n=1 Tax=Nakamurella flavida TaxID=363630 RepID=A0A938YSG4_9ACTN|nr:FCD domain-containing protein [Nakamurella flavida]MBM9478045.1 FadR family transcriptional regulator [Nakamurella flavida]MDP9778238.1 DNA-binding FadR family transcriptional regulator [Nakamurella flavida]